jgi:hypothetical protein
MASLDTGLFRIALPVAPQRPRHGLAFHLTALEKLWC